jgi:hypothetical protein
MSQPLDPGPFRLVVGVLWSDEAAGKAALSRCRDAFGPVASQLGPMPFTWTTYYDAEMGAPITRQFLRYERTVDPAALPEIKLRTNEMEQRFLRDGKRTVNLDPGVLTPWNLVLATGKPRRQRIYLGRGIFGDLTLVYYGGCFRPLEWTYPDWGSEEVTRWLGEGRGA